MKRTIIQLPDEMHAYLRQLAFSSNISMAELIRRIVDEYRKVKSHGPAQI